MFLRNIWYFAGLSKDVPAGKTQRHVFLGEPVLLGRTKAGTLFALHDICPHRGVPLSAGRLCHAGDAVLGERLPSPQVECPYHGWRFDLDGICRAIPSLVPGQDVDVTKIRVRPYSVRERNGLIWIYMQDREQRPGQAGPHEGEGAPPSLPGVDGEAQPRFREAITFSCHADHAVIGLMDPAHGPFVHRAWYWRNPSSIHEKAKDFGPSPLGFSMLKHPPSKNSLFYRVLGTDLTTEITFRLPGIRTELIQAGRQTVLGLTAVTPVDESRTNVTQIFFWAAGWLNIIRPFFRPFAKAFLRQDRDMVMLQNEGLKYNPHLMLINDADIQAKWYFRLKKAWEDSQNNGTPFENPVKPATLRWRS